MRPQDRPRRKQIPRLRRARGRDARGLSAPALRGGPRAPFRRARDRNPSCASGSTSSSTSSSKTGFTSYFLIVWDFIDYAKTHGIPVGPGRGSAAGSLIAYVLGITDLDPLRYGLFFERFLNPERISPPDIDVDFCYNRRGEVIEYVRKKYGEKSVAQIITFGTLGAKMAIRDVGRVMGLSYGEADRLAKMIPFDPEDDAGKGAQGKPRFQARLRRGGSHPRR